MLAQQRTSCLRLRPQQTRVHSTRCVVVTAIKPDMQHGNTTAHNSDTAVLVPVERSSGPVPVTQQGFGVGKASMLAAAALAVGFVVKRLRRRSEDMGYVYYSAGRNDPFMSGVMKNVNTVQMEELSPDIIAAARARRSRERANHKLDLEDIELPENHPWATRKPMSQEQEAAIAQRLQVRPRANQRGAGGTDPRSRVRQQNREQ
eukprot:GHUV01009420.1.p2 GENE.GHUV01009420.1~~GHUV01009420.1.p2  ORF type:complete len:204 (+),score=46.40 GHUV01009420.1:606-1217(+)